MFDDNRLSKYAAFLGATGVALGAFGAHGLKGRLGEKAMENWKTAVFYQLLHSVALLSLPNNDNKKTTAGHCMAFGTILFSGSIYGLCLEVGPKRLLGPTTPVGGLLMIAGWILLGF